MVFIWCRHFFPQICVWPKMHFPYHYWQQCQIDIGKFSIIGFVRGCTASFIKDDNCVCSQAATLHYANTTKYSKALLWDLISTFIRLFGMYRYVLFMELHQIQIKEMGYGGLKSRKKFSSSESKRTERRNFTDVSLANLQPRELCILSKQLKAKKISSLTSKQSCKNHKTKTLKLHLHDFTCCCYLKRYIFIIAVYITRMHISIRGIHTPFHSIKLYSVDKIEADYKWSMTNVFYKSIACIFRQFHQAFSTGRVGGLISRGKC